MTSKLGEIGEKRFLRNILPNLPKAPNFLNGFGDDSSIVDVGLARNIAFKIDRAPFPISIKRGWGNYDIWGRLAVVANVSDLIASAATPQAFMLSLVAPGEFLTKHAEQIIIGAADACSAFGLAFVGGDTKEGSVAQVVGSAFGTVDKNFYHRRVIAQPGDKLVIAGQLGGFLGALALADKFGLSDSKFSNWVELMNTPTPRIDEAAEVARLKLARAATDISDGLADVLESFCSTDIGVTICADSLPLHPIALDAAHRLGIAPIELAFSVGDWAIAYVVDGKMMTVLQHIALMKGLTLNIIGEFNESGQRLLLNADGSLQRLPTMINEHFVSRLEDR